MSTKTQYYGGWSPYSYYYQGQNPQLNSVPASQPQAHPQVGPSMGQPMAPVQPMVPSHSIVSMPMQMPQQQPQLQGSQGPHGPQGPQAVAPQQQPQPQVYVPEMCYYQYYPYAYAPRIAPTSLPSADSAQEEYDEALMVEFLASNAYAIMSGGSNMWTGAQLESFHMFVQGVIRSTRLCKHTVILSLCYLSHRWQLGGFPDPQECDYDMHYLLFVVSLVLANKIHDDNTFTNSSWCQATGIPASQVTHAEGRWLEAIGWDFNIHNTSAWHAWHERYQGFVAARRSPPTPPSIWMGSSPSPVPMPMPQMAHQGVPVQQSVQQTMPVQQAMSVQQAVQGMHNGQSAPRYVSMPMPMQAPHSSAVAPFDAVAAF